MPVYRAFLRTMGAVASLALAMACGGSKGTSTPAPSTHAIISGTVTYTRVPLVKDANGVPLGLADDTVATNLVTLPARGVQVRCYQQVEETQPNGSKVLVWVGAGLTSTDSSGKYSIQVSKDHLTLVELQSSFDGGNGLRVNLIGEPDGISSPTPSNILSRRLYALRKAADGTAPAGQNTPASMVSKDTTLDFSVGLKDAWWLVDTEYNLATSTTPTVTAAVLETDQPGRLAGEGSGSRILAIGDTLASHLAIYGTGTTGTTLDLHYWPGRSEPRGTYIEYDLSAPLYAPGQNYDSSRGQYHLFGSIRGDAANDDAWDEGVLLPLFARNTLYANNLSLAFSIGQRPLLPIATALNDLSPDMARLEGLVDAMAASVLKSPYLADTHGTTLSSLKDVRDLSAAPAGTMAAYSAPVIRALAWEIILKSNGITSPGTPTDWTKIDPLATKRLFATPPEVAASDGTVLYEPVNIYAQLKRLQETKASTEPVDLKTIFTDSTLTSLVTPFGLTWPRPTSGPESRFMLDWGTDPTMAMPPVSFSMASATQVNGAYPNVSKGEVAYAGFNLSVDKRYVLSTAITPALADGAKLQLDLPRAFRSFDFTGAGGSTDPLVIPVNGTAPYFQPVRIRLISPNSLQPDFVVTVSFTPAP